MPIKVEPLSPPGTCEVSHALESTTMAELGDVFPCGFDKPDGAPTSFAFRTPNMGVRRSLGEIRSRKDLQKFPGRATAYWLARALASLDGRPMESYGTEDARALAVAALGVGDVLYAMLSWHRLCHPRGFPVAGAACRFCGKAWESVLIDLGTLDVKRRPQAATQAEPLAARLALRSPLELPDSRKIGTLFLVPGSWLAVFWNVTRLGWENPENILGNTFRAALAGSDVVPMVPPDLVDQLMPDDCDALDAAIDEITPTPDMLTDVTCPECEHESRLAVNWRSADFLGQ